MKREAREGFRRAGIVGSRSTVDHVSIIMGCRVFPEAIPHPFGQLTDFSMGRLYTFRVFAPLARPFLCLGLAVTCSEDVVAWLDGTCPPLPEGESLVGYDFSCPLCNYVSPRNGNWFRCWEWRRHGEAGEAGRVTVLHNGLMENGGCVAHRKSIRLLES